MRTYNKDLWASIIAIGVAMLFAIASFWGTDAEIYLFPRIISILLVFLALMQCATNFTKMTIKDENRQVEIAWKGLLPGLFISIAYVLALEIVGFYFSAFLAFMLFVSIYGKRAATDVKAFILKFIIGVVLISVLYGLFWHLLNVRTPTGWVS